MLATTIRNWSDFDDLEPEWNKLLSRSRASTIFLTWEWIKAWRESTDEAAEPYVLTVRSSDGSLVGIAPLYVASTRLLGTVRYKTLRPLADIATGAEYPDWIVLGNHECMISDAIASKLMRNKKEWDLIWIRRMGGLTGALERICEPAERVGLYVRTRRLPFGSFELPDSLIDYEQGFSHKRRGIIRRNTRRVLQLDDTRFEECASADDLPEFLSALFELHQKRWRSTGKDGCFVRKPAEARFYRRFSILALGNGWLRIYAIRHKGKIVAVQIGYVFGDTFNQLQEGYDPDFVDGIGNALRHKVIERCIEDGVRTYDFLGGMTEHKRRWGAEEKIGYDVMIGAPSVKTALLFWKSVWPSGRFMDTE